MANNFGKEVNPYFKLRERFINRDLGSLFRDRTCNPPKRQTLFQENEEATQGLTSWSLRT